MAENRSNAGTRRLLLVEDEAILALDTAATLRCRGYAVQHLFSGEAAVERVVEAPDEFDLILMDINLGAGMSGTDAAREILRRRDIPIVFLSSHAEQAIVESTEEISSYGYVVKNTGITVLDASIKMAFRLFEARKSVNAKSMALEAANEELRVAMEELTNSESRFRAAFANAPVGMVLLSASGGLRMMNRAFCAMLGYSMMEATSVDFQAFIHPEDLAAGDDAVRKLLAGAGDSIRFTARYVRKDGGIVWVDESVSPLRNEEGEIRGLIIHALELMESDQLYRESFRKSSAVKLLIDPENQRIIDANVAASAYYGYPHESLVKMKVTEISPSSVEETSARMRMMAEGQRNHFYLVHRLASGEMRDVEVFSNPIEVGNRTLLHSIVHDITQQVRAQDALKRLVVQKETLMKELQHRVKNNLNVVTSLLELEDKKSLDSKAGHGPRGRDRPHQVDLGHLRKALPLGRPRERGPRRLRPRPRGLALLDLQPRPSPRLLARPLGSRLSWTPGARSRWGLILNELLSNSLKYAYPARPAGRDPRRLGLPGGGISLKVSDDGAGIPDEFLDPDCDSMG